MDKKVVVGIVGVEAAKLAGDRASRARELVVGILKTEKATHVCSGACHLGGIDSIAEEVCAELNLSPLIFKPKHLSWAGGYRDRNLQIAQVSDVVYCITVKTLPEGFAGMKFEYCYHCKTGDHVKSGGCWTTKEAKALGKRVVTLILD